MDTRIYKEQWLVPSLSKADKFYKVSLKHTGEYVCDCWPFRNSEEHPRTCRHIEDVQAGLYESEQEKENGVVSPLTYEFLMGHVPQVTVYRIKGTHIVFLIPLIPLDERGSDMDATIVYDLNVYFGVPMSVIKNQAKRPILERNNPLVVIAHVTRKGRTIWNRNPEKDGIEVLPVKDEE